MLEAEKKSISLETLGYDQRVLSILLGFNDMSQVFPTVLEQYIVGSQKALVKESY